eukprot:EG_transcript_24026
MVPSQSNSLSPLNAVGQTMPRYTPSQPLPVANTFSPQSSIMFQSSTPTYSTNQPIPSYTSPSGSPTYIRNVLSYAAPTPQPVPSTGLNSARSTASNTGATPRTPRYETVQAAKPTYGFQQPSAQRRSSEATPVAGPPRSPLVRTQSSPVANLQVSNPTEVVYPSLSQWQAAANFNTIPAQSNFTFYRILSTDGTGLDPFGHVPVTTPGGARPPVYAAPAAHSLQPLEAGTPQERLYAVPPDALRTRLQEPQHW